MNFSGKDKHVVLVVVGIIVAFLSYKFVFLGLGEKTETVEAQIAEADKEIESLQMYKESIDTYKTDIEKFKSDTLKVMASVPQEITMESIIQYLENMWSQYSFTINTITIGSPSTIYTFASDGSTASAINLSIEYSTDYETLKVLLARLTIWPVLEEV